jgi:ribosomal peptide maturation radical SAM protein 1
MYFGVKYPGYPLQMVDNTIPMRYFKDLLPRLANHDFDRAMFYEVRANLKRDHVQLLRSAGITHVQAGVESLSTPILKLMDKGVTALQNIQVLKWCREIGLDAAWNLLWGFPGEPAEEYDKMTRLVPLLTHLQPPGERGPIILERFSPHFQNPRQYGFSRVRPAPAYHHIYPLKAGAVKNLASFFHYDYRKPQEPARYTKPLQAALASWEKESESSFLCHFEWNGGLGIWDQRPAAHQSFTLLMDIHRELYEACDSVRSMTELRRVAARHTGRVHSSDEIKKLLSGMLTRGLMISEGDRYLSLSVHRSDDYPGDEVLEEIHKYLRTLGEVEISEHLAARLRLRELPIGLEVSRDELSRACNLPRSRPGRDHSLLVHHSGNRSDHKNIF